MLTTHLRQIFQYLQFVCKRKMHSKMSKYFIFCFVLSFFIRTEGMLIYMSVSREEKFGLKFKTWRFSLAVQLSVYFFFSDSKSYSWILNHIHYYWYCYNILKSVVKSSLTLKNNYPDVQFRRTRHVLKWFTSV